ncbi:MAG: thioredoxin-dependent thiol peroxidase [Bacteroidetes bacterium]|nr:thioredoxin-dependent thiol peroxidase [Bacteroidota bacterium]
MSSKLTAGDIAPDFTLKDSNDKNISLKDYAGKYIILYFYPKDDTPGCTTEAIDFTANLDFFTEKNALIFGVSADSVEKHCKFINKHALKVGLLSDEEKVVLESYDVWKKKKNFNKEYWGIVRSTFIIGPDQKIIKVWNSVSAKGHVEKVKDFLTKTIG